MKHYYPKSQTLQFGAVFIWGLCLLAIRQNMGLYLESGGLALAALLGLAVMGYLKSGKRVAVDVVSGEVRSVWRLIGIPLRVSPVRKLSPKPSSCVRNGCAGCESRGGSVKGVQKALVYDLVLVGHEDYIEEPPRDVVIDLTMDQMLFTLAERRARAVGRELNLPVAVRWDRHFDDVPREMRECGQWCRPLAYPQQMKDWRKWVSW